jgi:prepilin-type N-terminal cleavage/methylation domain-containing protein
MVGNRWWKRWRRGFTLLELLVVMVIILMVAALVGPLLNRSSRAVDEASRLVHGQLVGARDAAVHRNAPAGIRLMHDPSVPLKRLANGQVDPAAIVCANRIIPLEPAPDYSEGNVSIFPVIFPPAGFPPPYMGSSTVVYPYPDNVLMVEESPVNLSTGLPNPPTSWFWNIRVGDKLRFGDVGPLYTVVGPMTTSSAELLVNCGTPGVDFPGTKSPLTRYYNGNLVEVEFLFLVNGRDDDGDGFIDNGFDGVDNNLDGAIDDLGEWEIEQWDETRARAQTVSAPYTISRRPVPASGSRGVDLPSDTVIDLTTWSTSAERSRLPVNPYTGDVDILVTPAGDLVPTTIYSCPSSFRLSDALLHIWIADRGDLFDPDSGTIPRLPLPPGMAPNALGRELKGDIGIVTLNSRTGQITASAPAGFDIANVGNSQYNAGLPFANARK